MAYQVIARKWRPQIFSEVVFQDHVSRTIQNSIKQGRIPHAYLFSGPRGVGKTTMARILAKALNCMESLSPEPCGKCENCIEIKQGSSFDVIEIDGASNNGVENIRELRENVNFAPAKSRYKVYIIDEVHMVTTQAFNALLKTLEEPPPHVVFIFATTEIHKIPDTILSRCQKYFFKKIPVEPVVEHLKSIVKKEGYKISDGALYPVARIADGSMRDAQSILEQVISFSAAGIDEGSEISEEDTLSILGIVPIESYVRILNFISMADEVSILEEVENISSRGIDIARYAGGFMDNLRAIRLIQKGIDIQSILGLSEGEIIKLKDMASRFDDPELSKMFNIGIELLKNIRFASNDRIYLEMALLDMVAVIKSPSIAEIIKKLDDMGIDETSLPAKRSNFLESSPVVVEFKERTIESAWSEMLRNLSKQNNSMFYILRPAKAELNGDRVTIYYPDGIDSETYIKTLDVDTLDFIKKNLSDLIGRSVTVCLGESQSVSHKKGLEKKEEFPSHGDDSPLPEAEMLQTPENSDYEINSPAVAKLKDAFFGQIIKKGE